MNFGILRLYCGKSGEKGFYNLQELGLAKSMAKLGYNVYIFLLSTKNKDIEENIINDNIKIINVPCRHIGNHGFFEKNILKKYNIELLQIAADNQLYAPSVIKYCKKHKIQYYAYIGTLDTDSKNKINILISKLSTKRILKKIKNDISLAKTQMVKDKLNKKGIKNVELMPVGLDFDNICDIKRSKNEIFKEYNLPYDKKIIIFVGRLEKYKNPLECIELIKKIDQVYHLVIIGNGSLQGQLLTLIKNNNLESKVTYINQIKNDKIHELYSISDYFINFNKVEIFGMSILEALYNGVTVIAYHAPGPDFILKDNIGFLVNTTDEMINIINSNKTMNRDTLKEWIINNYNWDNNAKMIDKYYKIK